MIVLDLSILNQKGTPMFNSDTFANRPTFGIVGRIFISTDTAAIYRDTGTAWDLIADGGSSSTNIYNSNGTLSGNRTVSSGGFNLTFNPSTTFDTTLTAANNASSLALFGVNRLSYAAAFSANNIGSLYGGASAFALQTFAGSATFANSNVASGGSSVNSIDFSTGGSTITITQSSGIRAMTGQQNLFQYQGTNSGTITHAAISQNTGFYRPSAATGILTITNAYSHLINALDDYGAGFTFTNRFGIYQAGASDVNYFAATILVGSTTNSGEKAQITGTAKITGNTAISAGNLSIFTTNTPRRINLQVANGSKAAGIGIESGGSIHSVIGPDTSGNDFLQIASKSGIAFYSGSTIGNIVTDPTNERMRLTTSGNLLLGSTSDTGQIFQVTGTTRLNGETLIVSASGLTIRNGSTDGFSFQQSAANSWSWTALTSGSNYNIQLASVGIGTATPDASSLLDVTSLAKGFLPPRMTTAQKNSISSPAAGLIVYDTTLNKLCVRTAAAWETITSI
jgi:hypothetical protein